MRSCFVPCLDQKMWLMSWRLWELHADHAWHLYLLLRPLKGAASFNLHWNEMRWYEIFWYEMRRDWIRSFVVYAYSLWIFCIHKTKVDACVILIEPDKIRPCPFWGRQSIPPAWETIRLLYPWVALVSRRFVSLELCFLSSPIAGARLASEGGIQHPGRWFSFQNGSFSGFMIQWQSIFNDGPSEVLQSADHGTLGRAKTYSCR